MNYCILFPEGKTKSLTFSFDDARKEDGKLVSLFNRYNVKATFNISTGLLSDKDGMFIDYSEIKNLYKGHEVACHTFSHAHLNNLSDSEAEAEISKDIKNLELQTGYAVRGMAYPYGEYSDRIIRIAQKCGIVYSRTVESTEDFSLFDGFMKMKTTCHQSNEKLFSLAESFNRDDSCVKLFSVWGHSYELSEKNSFSRFEEFIGKVSKREDVWYATNIEICDYINAFGFLKYSEKSREFENKSPLDLYILKDNRAIKIKARSHIIP